MELDLDDAFAELGLRADASERDIKAAWRRLVSRWHPDRNASASALARMQRINRAVEAIRQAGRLGASVAGAAGAADDAPAEPRAARRPDTSAQHAGAAAADDAPPEAGPAHEAPARTIRRRVRLSLEEAATGCTKLLRGTLARACAACDGQGFRVPGGHCPRCRGSGAVWQGSWFGWPGTRVACEACHGGGLARQPCAACAGSGQAPSRRYAVQVRFPHGVRDGDLLVVKAGPGTPSAPPGTLEIRVEVQPHPFLRLEPDGTVRCEMPVDGFAWVANHPVPLPTLDGLHSLPLQRGQLRYRLKGMGFPVDRRGPRGDLWVHITPVFAPKPSTDQQILLDQLVATTTGPDAPPPDDTLARWQHQLRAWQRGAARRR
ncbi:MAG: J domain-containing protein [Burkholderiales bacterium]|nr:J domain-containing protein [Burkholderiales bacterium]